MDTVVPENILQRLPKTDLHRHLVGSIRPSTCVRLMDDNGIASPFEGDPSSYFTYENFDDFIKKYSFLNSILLKPPDFSTVMKELITDMLDDNIRYAEISISPLDHMEHGIGYDEMMAAIDSVVVDAESDYDIKINYIVDLVRNYGPEQANDILMQTLRLSNPRIVAVGLGGHEHSYPASEFKRVISVAKDHNLKSTVHAGEYTDAAAVRDTIQELAPDRIGHGIKAAADLHLMQHLRYSHIPVEICMTSNVATGTVDNIESHPVKMFLEEKVPILLGTDDPAMFHTSLTNEYRILHETFRISFGELRQIILNGIQYAFLKPLEKHHMLQKFAEEFHTLKKYR